ncbi:MAG: hypothetical protein DBY30_10110 [Verrucomicrobia bacterium]|nr:MAG: hypothetical protein DBY30_10110 [Verrucomicrobiota bacterium]
MLLANSCVREAAKTARVCLIRHAPLAASLYSLFIQNGFAGLVALRGRGARLPQRGQAPWRLAKPMRLPPKFPHMEFCIYPNKMPTHFILPESLIL